MINKGSYLLLLFLDKEISIPIGKLGTFTFPKGWYCYVGSAMNNLQARIERHLRTDKKMRWHIDYLRQHAVAVEAISLASREKIECILNEWVSSAADVTPVRRFGSSDCACFSHLHHFVENPGEMLMEMLNIRVINSKEEYGPTSARIHPANRPG